MRLYEIDNSIRLFWEKIADQDGELTDEDIKTLDELNVARDDKIKAYGVLIRELDGESEELSKEIKRLKDLALKKEKLRDKLFGTLENFLTINEIPKFESKEVTISFRKSTALEIDEGVKIPKAFLRLKTETDRTALKEFLKNGGEVYGCRLKENRNMQIK